MTFAPMDGQPPVGPGGHLNEDRCLDLLHGLLPPEECHAALAHMATCPSCERLMRDRAGEREWARARHRLLVTSRGLELQTIAAGRRQPGTAGASPAPIAPPAGAVATRAPIGRLDARLRRALAGRMLPVAVAAAAVIAVVLLVRPQGDGHGARDLHPLPTGLAGTQLRAAGAAPELGPLLAGIAAYEAGDYERAAEQLRDATGVGHLENVRSVYLGSALAWCGRHAQAVLALESIDLRLLPDPWGTEGLWTLAVALRATGQRERADAVLQELAREPGPVGDRARAALP